jgi:hypothetical protein
VYPKDVTIGVSAFRLPNGQIRFVVTSNGTQNRFSDATRERINKLRGMGIDIVEAPRDRMNDKRDAEVAAIRLGRSGSEYCGQPPLAIGTSNYHCDKCRIEMSRYVPQTIQASIKPKDRPKTVYPHDFVGPLPPGAIIGLELPK